MDESFVNAIRRNAQAPVTVKIGRKAYLCLPDGEGGYAGPPEGPELVFQAPEILKVHTLQALADYLESKVDEGKAIGGPVVAIHVESPTCVSLIGPISDEGPRPKYLVATVEREGFPFGRWIQPEEFLITAQARIVATEERARLLRLVGTIKSEKVRTNDDDGVTQMVTAREGIVRVSEVQTPNPINLQPYRTFAEVNQPESPFIVRIQPGEEDSGNIASIALFEADGGAWKLDAIHSIESFLRAELPDVKIIA